MVAGPSAVSVTGTVGAASRLSCTDRLASGRQPVGVVAYTPTEYLLIMPPFAPTNANSPRRRRATATASAIACIEELLPAPPTNGRPPVGVRPPGEAPRSPTAPAL